MSQSSLSMRDSHVLAGTKYYQVSATNAKHHLACCTVISAVRGQVTQGLNNIHVPICDIMPPYNSCVYARCLFPPEASFRASMRFNGSFSLSPDRILGPLTHEHI